MAATSAGAVKAKLEGAGLGIPFFRDEAPEGQAPPYGTIKEALSVVPEAGFNPLAGARPISELLQVDLWQQYRDQATRALTESQTLAGATFAALDGVRLPSSPTLVYQCSVTDSRRILERDDNLVHTALTVELRRNR